MHIGRSALTVALCCLAATPAIAGEELLYGPPAAWVAADEGAPPPGEENGLPARVELMDSQVRFEDDRQQVYSALAIRFQTPEGLGGGNLTFAWDPETQDITIHRVLIRRADETIDVLESGQTFTVLRREQNLEQAMLDGTLTATMFPEGLQVGDVLEFASTLTTRDPVLAGHGEIAMGPLNAPLDRLRWRIQWPTGKHFALAATDDLPDWRQTRENGFETAELSLDDVEPVALPRLAPLRYAMVRFVEASDYSSWADVAALEIPLYAKAARIPAQGPLRNEVERIRESSTDPVARTEAALALVQGRIRYVALAMGAGGLVPADAEETWARRYGDCKAKTALLLAILGELGIEAHAVTVHTELGDTLARRLPSIGAFDHILVRARIGGRDYWLDGTRTGDTSLARLQTPDFGWGLPIVEGAELVRMVPAPFEEPHSDIVIHMDASKGVRAPVPARIELTLRGDAAIGANQAFANFVGEARDRSLREFWRRRFDFVTPEKVGLAFDRDAAELRLTLEGAAALDWNGVWYETDETGLGYKADFTREAGPGSDAPYVVGHPFYTRTRQTIVLPPGFAAPGGEDMNVDETVAGVEYKRTVAFSANTLTIEASERSVAPEFAARDAPAFEKRLREMADNAVYLRIPNGYRPTAGDLAVTEAEMPESVSGVLAQGYALLDSARYDEALTHFRRAIELEADNADAWANLGITLVWKGSLEEAATALDKAETLNPRHPVIFRARGLMAQQRGDAVAAIAAFDTALELDPESLFAMGNRAMAHMAAGDANRALADAADAIERSPQYIEMYAVRAFALSSLGRTGEAVAELDRMLAANPEDTRALTVAATLYPNFGAPEKARDLADGLAQASPSPMSLTTRAQLRDPADIDGQLADLDEALRLDPAYQPALMARASLRQANGEREAALADTEAILDLNPQLPEVNLLRANIFRSMDRRDDALAEAEAVVAANPDDAWAHVAAGKIYGYFGEREKALAAIDRGIGMEPVAAYFVDRAQVREESDKAGRMADLEEALRLFPGDQTVLAAKADLLVGMGEHERAIAVYDEALDTSVDNAMWRHRRGVALWRLGRLVEAEDDFARVRSLTHDAMMLNNICYMKAVADVALERALEECEESLRLRPDFAPTLDSRGAVLLRPGRLDEAIRDFDRVLEQSPDLRNSRYLRAVARSLKGDFAGAGEDLAIVREDGSQFIESMEREGFVVAVANAEAAE